MTNSPKRLVPLVGLMAFCVAPFEPVPCRIEKVEHVSINGPGEAIVIRTVTYPSCPDGWTPPEGWTRVE